MDFRGRTETEFFPEYVRRSKALREKKPAYDCMRKADAEALSRVAPQDLSLFILSQQEIAGTGFFIFSKRYINYTRSDKHENQTMAMAKRTSSFSKLKHIKKSL